MTSEGHSPCAPPTQKQILSAFRGATKSEISKVTFPSDFADIDFSRREFYGWRDAKMPRRAYVVVERDDEFVALLLNRSEAKPRRRAMCSWCRDVDITEDALLYTVRRAGARGRKGDTLGILVCEDFNCPKHARKLPPAYHKGHRRRRDPRTAGRRHGTACADVRLRGALHSGVTLCPRSLIRECGRGRNPSQGARRSPRRAPERRGGATRRHSAPCSPRVDAAENRHPPGGDMRYWRSDTEPVREEHPKCPTSRCPPPSRRRTTRPSPTCAPHSPTQVSAS
ncbi:FBP domain-containing protein [Gordonia humi]|uniref:FBP domain-containing protein n=1 Tax=Gordonia humi TaxID=686429 RepID=UPI00362139D8